MSSYAMRPTARRSRRQEPSTGRKATLPRRKSAAPPPTPHRRKSATPLFPHPRPKSAASVWKAKEPRARSPCRRPEPRTDLPPILTMDERCRLKILRLLSYEDRRRCQEVCRTLRSEIRCYVGLASIISDKTSEGLVFMRDILMAGLYVTNFKKNGLAPSEIIGNPDRVQLLVFQTPIALQHFDSFLSTCRCVKGIFVHGALSDFRPENKPKGKGRNTEAMVYRPLDLIIKAPPRLECLTVLLLSLPAHRGASLLGRFLQALEAPNLLSFGFQISEGEEVVQSGSYHMRILPFIEKCPRLRNLLTATTRLRDPHRRDEKYLGWGGQRVVGLGKALRLREMSILEPDVAYEVWPLVIKYQTELEVYRVLQVLPHYLHETVLGRNLGTLRIISMNVEPTRDGDPFDLGLLALCPLLQELYIGYAGKSQHRAVVSNLDLLPLSITVLALKHCTYAVPEFMSFFRRVRRLTSLGLVSRSAATDIELSRRELYELLVGSRHLDELLVSGFVSKDIYVYGVAPFINQIRVPGLKGRRRGIYVPHPVPNAPTQRWSREPPFSFAVRTDWAFPRRFSNPRKSV